MLAIIFLYALPLVVFFAAVQNYNRLRHVPGPFLASLTDLWRLWSVYQRKPHEIQLQLHQKYGDVVRLGPNCVSVRGPEYTSQIYGIGKGFIKSDFYSVFQNIVNGRRAASLVAMTDESTHAKTKRQIAHAYSLSTLVEFEPLVDSTINVFLDQLGQRYAAESNQDQAICDFGQYLQFFAFDVIGELTFSKRLGFIETNSDVDHIIAAIGANFNYFSVLGQMPWLDSCLGKNPLYIKFFAKPVSSPILQFAQKLLSERLQNIDDGNNKEKPESSATSNKPDFLSRFLQARKDDDEPMSDRQLLSFLFMNINAGSDTIASTLRGIFHYLFTNPTSLQRLIDELQTAHAAGHLTLPMPTWAETQSDTHTPYLRAVIKEGLRLNPALSLPLERIVPGPQGLTLHPPPSTSSSTNPNPIHLPPGTIVGINPWVQHRDPRIFSSSSSSSSNSDSAEWDPQRWLTPTEKSTKTMEHALLAFGAGKRSCLGKNIAMLELHKLVPAVLMRFRLDFVDATETPWQVKNAWVLNQTGLLVRVSEREGEAVRM